MKLNEKIKIKLSKEPVHFDYAIDFMKNHLTFMKNNQKGELLWFLEHESIYTAGTSAKNEDQNIKNKNLIRYTNRGGQWTWHGNGQRVVYIMLDLSKREKDIKKFINRLENWIIVTLDNFNISSVTRENYPGVWIEKKKDFFKIASIGIRISNWITWHGVSINLNPKLDNFDQIIPCGVKNSHVTSMKDQGVKIDFKTLDKSLIDNFKNFF